MLRNEIRSRHFHPKWLWHIQINDTALQKIKVI